MVRAHETAFVAAATADIASFLVGLLDCIHDELAFHVGLDWTVREEIEQEIALWLVEKWPSISLPRFPRALAVALVRQFLRPNNARRYEVEQKIVSEAAAPHSILRVTAPADERLAAAEWLRALTPKDRRLAARLLAGASWIQACDEENVPPGSRAFLRARIKAQLVD